jgi:hypothetical protein
MNIKKILPLALAFALALTALSGCWWNRVPDLEDRIGENGDQEYEYTGVIETLAIDAYQQGTHQLETDAGKLVIIQSRDFDLNRYLDKRVVAKGYEAEVIGDAEPVLNITDIEFEDGSTFDELLDYENRFYGLRFTYPSAWELAETSEGLDLSADEYDWVIVYVYSDKSDLEAFVSSQESEEGTSVTIGAQKSIRFVDNSSVRVYVQNPPKKKVYKIIYNEESREENGEKEKFYDLLESFQLIYSSVRKGEKCGGKEDIKCDEGYRCELESTEKDAEGICVSLVPEDTELECPFIPPPTDCSDYRVAEYSKSTGCPARYQCVDDGVDLREEGLDTGALTATIEKYKDQILGVSGAEIIQYELTESESLIAVVYEHEEGKYRTLYSFTPSANEFNFIEKAHFEEGEDRDWKLISGDDVQAGHSKTVIKAEEASAGSRQISSDMRLYENQHKDFSLEYPQNWYYRSFGAISGTHWIVGFADKPLDYLSDAIITVSIVEDESDSDADMYMTTRNRDDDTIYVIEGPADLEETVDKMADSIE